MARWLASDVPEWVAGVLLLVGLPALMVLLQALVHRLIPVWRRGVYNDAAGIMLSATVVVYSVSIGLCVVTLWDKYEEARQATAAEAMNLAALANSAGVLGEPARQSIRASVLAYNRDVVDRWPERMRGDDSVTVSRDLEQLIEVVGQVKPESDAQRAYVEDAVARLASATELRATALRLAHEQKLPSVLWIAVLGGSVIVLGLCLTCGVQHRALRMVLLVGVAATVAVNLFLVVELNYPFYGDIGIRPESYQDVARVLEQAG